MSASQRIQPKRIQRSRTRGWRLPEGAIVVTRPTKYGNPIRCSDRAVAVEGYRAWVAREIAMQEANGNNPWPRDQAADRLPLLADLIAELRGHDLCCWVHSRGTVTRTCSWSWPTRETADAGVARSLGALTYQRLCFLGFGGVRGEATCCGQ